MKKILIQHTNMPCGGVESSIANFLHLFKDDYDIQLSLLSPTGPMMERLEKNVSVIGCGQKAQRYFSYDRNIKKHMFIYKVIRKAVRLIKKIIPIDFRFKLLFNDFKNKNNYDIAISYFAHSIPSNYYILNKINADIKIAYIHMDLNSFVFKKIHIKQLEKFDKILCVSKECLEQFNKLYPQFVHKSDFLYNSQNIEEIKELSNKKVDEFDSGLNFVSVARVAPMKAQLRTIEVIHKLSDEGYDFRWHVIGDGPDFEKLKNYVLKNGLNKKVVLYGYIKNPYPYIKKADAILQLSAFGEACPMVYAESMILKTPVISTDTLSAHEILDDYGLVCKNNIESIYSTLKRVLDDSNLVVKMKKNLENFSFNNKKIIEKFKDIVS